MRSGLQKPITNLANSNRVGVYRAGGLAAVFIGVSYVVITVLYVLGGTLPGRAEECLGHLAAHTTEWWLILGLSVLTDFLFLFVAWSVYAALETVNKNLTLVGSGLLGLFVILDLAITWPNYSSLITLSSKYHYAVSDTQRIAFVTTANYAVEVLSSGLFAVYAILVPSLGILLISIVMRKGVFNKITAYVGIVTGILGIISVIGPFFVSAFGVIAIIASVLTTAWVFLVGFRLFWLIRVS